MVFYRFKDVEFGIGDKIRITHSAVIGDFTETGIVRSMDSFGIELDAQESTRNAVYWIMNSEIKEVEVLERAQESKGADYSTGDTFLLAEIPTSIGKIKVQKTGYGPEYPGISIDFVKEGQKQETPLALIEVCEDEEKPTLNVRLWVRNEPQYNVDGGGRISYDEAFEHITFTGDEIPDDITE